MCNLESTPRAPCVNLQHDVLILTVPGIDIVCEVPGSVYAPAYHTATAGVVAATAATAVGNVQTKLDSVVLLCNVQLVHNDVNYCWVYSSTAVYGILV